MFPVIQVGPIALQAPGLALLVGLWLGLSLAERHATEFDVNPNLLYSLSWVALVGGIIGARLAYVVQYPSAFTADPLGIVSLNPGLLDAWGGAVGLVLAGLAYLQRKNIPLWPALDALTSTFGVMAVAVGVAHLASGEAYGAPAAIPWAVNLFGAARHPSQVYEILAAAAILWAVWPRRGQQSPAGSRFWRFTAFTAGAILFLDAFRGDSAILAYGIHLSQVAAWIVLATSLWQINHRSSKEVFS